MKELWVTGFHRVLQAAEQPGKGPILIVRDDWVEPQVYALLALHALIQGMEWRDTLARAGWVPECLLQFDPEKLDEDLTEGNRETICEGGDIYNEWRDEFYRQIQLPSLEDEKTSLAQGNTF